jgi:hypothetical protein
MEKLSLTRVCRLRKHWRSYVKVAWVHGIEILWCNECNAITLRKVDKLGPLTDNIFKTVSLLKDLISKHDLKGRSLESSWLVNYIMKNADFPHSSTVRNALGWLVEAHGQVRGLSLDGILTMEPNGLAIKEGKLVPVEVYVIKPDISGDPEYLPIVFECPICGFCIPISNVEYGKEFSCPKCWSWYTWHDTFNEPQQVPPPSWLHTNLYIKVGEVKNGEPIEGAQVSVSSEDFPDFKRYAFTDKNGVATFNVPLWRKLIVEVTRQDYKSSSFKTLVMNANESFTVGLKKITIWDYALPIVATFAVVVAPLVIIGLSRSVDRSIE